jgi:hypothetical protein
MEDVWRLQIWFLKGTIELDVCYNIFLSRGEKLEKFYSKIWRLTRFIKSALLKGQVCKIFLLISSYLFVLPKSEYYSPVNFSEYSY